VAKVSKNSTSWLFDPSLNNPTIDIKRKTVKKNISMLLETLCIKNKSNDERIGYLKSNHDKKEKSVKQVWTQKVDKRYFGFIDRNFDLIETKSKRTRNGMNEKEKMFVMKSSIYPQNFTSIGVGLTIEIILGVGCPLVGRKF
jgi:hypothetical protein